MRMPVITTKIVIVSVIAVVVALISLNAGGGSLDPTEPPGPTMRTLDEIYNAVAPQAPVAAAVDMFLKIDTIPGESTDADHKDWIEILSYSHGITQPTDIGGGGTSGRADLQDLSVTKYVDKSTPKLNLRCCDGDRLDKVEIDLVRSTSEDKHYPYLNYVLTDCIVTSYSISGDADDRPTEEVSFNYSKIEWTYTQSDDDGMPVGNVEAHWDVASNTGN